MKRSFILILSLVAATLFPFSAHAEVKVIDAESTYIMGDNDSKIDARRIATQEAKRKALELAGTYVESLSQVKNYQLTKDEIKSYTAGVLETEVVSEQMRGTTVRPEIYIKTRCKVDTAVLTAKIEQFRKSEELKEQLNASAKENDALRKERDTLVKQLQAEKDKTKAAQTRQKLETVLAKEEANDETHKVWINIGSQLVQVDDNGRPIKQADLDNSSMVLQKAIKTNPQNQRARTMLASIYARQGNRSAAEAELKEALQRRPSDISLRMKLGMLLEEQGNYAAALREFHFVERLRPHDPLMLFHTGMTFKQTGQCNRTVQYLNRFLKDPRANAFPKRREAAKQAVQECGGDRPGRPPRRPPLR